MKLVLLIFLSLFISGCSNENLDEIKNYGNYYSIFNPYKEGVSNNYALSTLNNINIEEVELYLMDISSNFFNPNNYYYQSGQYLKESDLKNLLNEENINDSEEIEIDGIKLKPKYVTMVHEQNYLDNKGDLRGVSLGIVLNQYQSYNNSYGATLYKKMDYETLFENGQNKASKIVQYYRSQYGLPDMRILVALFFQSNPRDIIPGTYKSYGITTTNTIKFKNVNYEYNYLDSNFVSNNDQNNYNAYIDLVNEFKEMPYLYINGYLIYKDNNPLNIVININSSKVSKNLLLNLNQRISEKYLNSFNFEGKINIYIKSNDVVKSVLYKEKNQINSTINLLDWKKKEDIV